jgi:formate dehydrogenase beta subunit
MDEIGFDTEQRAELRDMGIKLRHSVRVTRLMGKGDSITNIAYSDPRVRAASGEEGEHVIEADSVVVAGGRLPEMIFAPWDEEQGGGEDQWQTLVPYRDPSAEPRGIFAAAEPVSDYRAAVEAVAGGRRAAASVHKHLTGQSVTPPEKMLTPESHVLDVNTLVNLMEVPEAHAFPRYDLPEDLPIEAGETVELSEEAAREEAKRCLNCGLICYYRTTYH